MIWRKKLTYHCWPWFDEILGGKARKITSYDSQLASKVSKHFYYNTALSRGSNLEIEFYSFLSKLTQILQGNFDFAAKLSIFEFCFAERISCQQTENLHRAATPWCCCTGLGSQFVCVYYSSRAENREKTKTMKQNKKNEEIFDKKIEKST